MNKKAIFLTLPLVVLTAIICGCSGNKSDDPIMAKDSGYKISATKPFNTLDTYIDATSLQQMAFYVAKAVASESTAVYIKTNFDTENITVSGVMKVCEIDAHFSVKNQLKEYSLSGGTWVPHSMTGNSKINYGCIMCFEFNYNSSDAASYHTTKKYQEAVDYTPIKNGNMAIRLNNVTKRASDFVNFPIETHNNGEFLVHNSEELWWALEQHYLPTFNNDNCRAKALYEEAKKICKEIISDDMTDYQKITTLYEYLTSEIIYDHQCLYDDAGWVTNTSYYPEGSLIYKKAVCDSFSKTFCVFAGIENLDVIRAFGYEQSSGHAWNLASIDGGNTYYLVCPTWGRNEIGLSSSHPDWDDDPINVTSYWALMTKNSFFKDAGGVKFSDDVWSDKVRASGYLDYFTLDTYEYGGVTYDYKIDSLQELEAMIASYAAIPNYAQRFTLQFRFGNLAVTDSTWTQLKEYLYNYGIYDRYRQPSPQTYWHFGDSYYDSQVLYTIFCRDVKQ